MTGASEGIITVDSVRGFGFIPDGRTHASVGWGDENLYLWDGVTGEHRHTLKGHTGIVITAAFSPDGRTIASGGDLHDDTVRLWDTVTGEHKRTLTGHTRSVQSVVFSPDGGTLASTEF